MIRQGGNLTHGTQLQAFVSDSDLEVTHGLEKKPFGSKCGGMQDSSALTEFYPKIKCVPALP